MAPFLSVLVSSSVSLSSLSSVLVPILLTLMPTSMLKGNPNVNRYNMPTIRPRPISAEEVMEELDEDHLIQSKCQCGKLSISVPLRAILPLEFGTTYKAAVDCHCTFCRKYHVSAFCSYLLCQQDAVQMEGDTLKTYRDSCSQLGPVVRLQCQACYSKLATRPLRVEERFGHQLLLNLGPINDQTLPVSLCNYFQENRMQWQWKQRASWTNAAAVAESIRRGERTTNKPFGITGSCACGQAKFRIRLGESTELQHCYCTICRRVSGGPFQTWVPFDARDFEWIAAENVDGSRSSDDGHAPPTHQYVPHGRRHVCHNCGSVLTIQYIGEEDMIWPAAGAVDDGSIPGSTFQLSQHLHAVMHISCRYKQSWYALPNDGNPRIPEAG